MGIYDDTIVAEGAGAYWPMNAEPNPLADLAGSSTSSTMNGTAVAGDLIDGIVGIDATDADWVIPYRAPQAAYSIEAWIRWTGSTSLGEQAIVADWGGAAAIGAMLYLDSATGHLRVFHRTTMVAGPVIPANTWCHVVATWNGTTIRLYLNGTEVATGTDVTPPGISTEASRIGAYGYTSDVGYRRFRGRLARLAWWDRALTATDITGHYNLGLQPEPEPGVIEAAIDFTAAATLTVTTAPEPEDTNAAVTFTVTATFDATATADAPAVAVAAIDFAVTGALDVIARPVGRRRRLVVVDTHGEPYGELENANIGAVTFVLNEPESFAFTLPITDPKAHLLLDEKFREVQLWRGDQLLAWGPAIRPSADKNNLAVTVEGVLWYLTRRFIGRASRRNYVNNGDFENGTDGWEIGALNPLESFATRSASYWAGTVTTDRAVTGRRSLRLEQHQSGTPKYGVSASQFFVWDVDPAATPEGDRWSLVAQIYIPADSWRGPPPDGIGLRLSRFSTSRTVSIAPEGGGPAIDYPAPIETVTAEINEDTPRDVWHRLEATMLSPVTGEPEFVQVSVNAPDGAAYFDRIALSLDEGLRYYATDQADIAAGIVAHLQDPEYGKTDLNLSIEMPATGVRRDRTYLFHEHPGGFDAVNEFTTLNNGMDFSVALTPTRRTIRSHHPARGTHRPAYRLELARNVAEFAWAFDGEGAANHIVVLGSGNGSDREEAWATYPSAYADGLTLETVYTSPPETPIDSLEAVALEELAISVTPDVLTVTTTRPLPGQPDPIGILACGDTVPVSIRTGPLPIEGVYRVVAMTLTPDDTLDLTLNRRTP